jgi:hypothetical protein
MKRYRYLTGEQVEEFLTHGYILLRDCFPRKEIVPSLRELAMESVGYKIDDPSTWEKGYIRIPALDSFPMSEFAPNAWAAACDLLGGEERVVPCDLTTYFYVNLRVRADEPWVPPGPDAPGYHKDGDYFRHFLDSPEQGLLTLVYWSDTQSQCGGTFVVPDSIKPVARYLLDHPEGVMLNEYTFGVLAKDCHEFTEVYGNTGDIALIHPFMLHATSQNMKCIPRFLTNPPIKLKEPMQFNRENPDDFSPVELAILRALGVERLDFKPTAPREQVISKREKEMMEEIRAREQAAQAN